MIDLSLYLVTARGKMSLENFFKIILDAIKGGVTVVQLREKEASFDEVVLVANQLLELLQPLGIPLIINDRIDVALETKAAGIHLGQSDLNVAEARKILGKEAIIGQSIETLNDAKMAMTQDVNYIAASPLFPTNTKPNCAAPIGLSTLKEICLISSIPVIAIGGINVNNVQSVFEAGVTGVAVVSAIFDAPSPMTAARSLRRREYAV